MKEQKFRTSPDSLKRLIKDCEAEAADPLCPGNATTLLQAAVGAMEAYLLDMKQPN